MECEMNMKFVKEKIYGIMLASILITTCVLTTVAVGASPGFYAKNQLLIASPDHWWEGYYFGINVSADGRRIANVTVIFANHTYYTNEFGHASLYAPMVNHNTTMYIYASKQGYLPDQNKIFIINWH